MTGRMMRVGIAVSVVLSGCGGDSGPVAPPPPPPPPPPVVTTVEVALAAGTLLPGDTTVATATVKDQNGTVMTGQSVTWASSGAAADVSGTGAVVARATGQATISATVSGRTGTASVSVVRDDRFGYIWADASSTPSYTVDNDYEYLSSGAKASITRAGLGDYAVTMTGLAAGPGQRTNVQVSAYSTGSAYCQLNGWQNSGADLVAGVRCFNAAGAPADARFTLLATGGTALEGRLGFALAHDQAATAAYVPQQARHSRGGPVTITRSAPGRYRATFTGLNRTDTDGPEQVFVTAVGTAGERCRVQVWSTSTFSADIACANPAGEPTDTKFSLLMLEQGRAGAKTAFAWADQPGTAGPYDPYPLYSFNSTGGTNRITRSSPGNYSVVFPNFSRTPGAAETVIVTAYGGGETRCRIGSWSSGSVSIVCYDTAGNPVDSAFDVLMIQ